MSIAQAEIAGLEGIAPFQQQLLEQTSFIVMLYGAIFVAGFMLLTAFTLRIQYRPLSWGGPLNRLNERPWDWQSCLRLAWPVFLLQALFGLVFAWYESGSNIDPEELNRWVLVVQSILFHWVCLGLIALYLRRRRWSWGEAFGFQRRGIPAQIGWGILVLLGIMPFVIASNVVMQVLMEWWGLAPEIQEVTRIISGASGWPARIYFVCLAVVVAPLVEEMLFRGILLPALARVVGVRGSLVLVGITFAFVHGVYVPYAVILFILSIAFSLAYIYRGSLLVPVVMHALFNGLTMLVLLRM